MQLQQGAMEPRAHRPSRDAERLPNLGGVKTCVKAQDHHRSQVTRERIDGCVEIERPGVIARARIRVEHGEKLWVLFVFWQGLHPCPLLSLETTLPVPTDIYRDLQQPWAYGVRIAQRGPGLPCAQRSLLRGVFSLRWADERSGDTHHGCRMDRHDGSKVVHTLRDGHALPRSLAAHICSPCDIQMQRGSVQSRVNSALHDAEPAPELWLEL